MSGSPERVLVLGLARSGQAAARRARAARGGGGRRRPRRSGTTADLALLDGVELLVKSPGVPREAPLVAEARAPRDPDLERDRARLPAPASRGSSASPARTARRRPPSCSARCCGAPIAGNVGRALTELDGEVEPGALVVCELSSFQLEDVHELACEVAVLLNLEPDHLDRHGVLRGLPRREAADLRARPRDTVVPRDQRPATGSSSRRATRCRPSRSIRGAHNRENAAAATAAARALGASDEQIAEALRTFPGVPHRLELVAEVTASAT